MKKTLVLVLIAALSGIMVMGCGQVSENEVPSADVSITEVPENKSTNLKSAEFDSEEDFWKCAEDEYTTSFQSVKDREKTFSFVVVDGVVAICKRISDYQVELTIGYELADGTYSFYEEKYSTMSMNRARYGEDLLDKLAIDDKVRICYYNGNTDGVDFTNLVGIKKIGHDDNFVEQYLDEHTDEKSGSATDSSDVTYENKTSTEKRTPTSVKFGTLLDANPNGGEDNTLVIKVKIEPNLTNKMTISQNYHNIIDIVKDQKCDTYDSIDYWAVADMSDGSEGKVISFLVNKNVIEGINAGNIVATTLEDNLTDLWILPSLLD